MEKNLEVMGLFDLLIKVAESFDLLKKRTFDLFKFDLAIISQI
jgi:hypothetical protein